MNGKEKCKILKQIRQEIAQRNGIDYIPSDCNNEGDCLGYCPICEKEAEFILSEINKKIKDGHSVRIELENEFVLNENFSPNKKNSQSTYNEEIQIEDLNNSKVIELQGCPIPSDPWKEKKNKTFLERLLFTIKKIHAKANPNLDVENLFNEIEDFPDKTQTSKKADNLFKQKIGNIMRRLKGIKPS